MGRDKQIYRWIEEILSDADETAELEPFNGSCLAACLRREPCLQEERWKPLADGDEEYV